MKIAKITFTGADDSTQPESLIELSRCYPFIEWGILVSRNSAGSGRFPSLEWIDCLFRKIDEQQVTVQLAGHVCGGWERDMCKGEPSIFTEAPLLRTRFQRYQLNFHGERRKFNDTGLFHALQPLSRERGCQFIFQHDNVNNDVLLRMRSIGLDAVPLFDLSHGAGVAPDQWPAPLPMLCGYAGGLGPETIEHHLPLIREATNGSAIWIDMETRVRSCRDEIFDLSKCLSVLNKVNRFLCNPTHGAMK